MEPITIGASGIIGIIGVLWKTITDKDKSIENKVKLLEDCHEKCRNDKKEMLKELLNYKLES